MLYTCVENSDATFMWFFEASMLWIWYHGVTALHCPSGVIVKACGCPSGKTDAASGLLRQKPNAARTLCSKYSGSTAGDVDRYCTNWEVN